MYYYDLYLNWYFRCVELLGSSIEFCGAEAVSSCWWLSAGGPAGRLVPKCNKRLVTESQKAPSRWRDHPNNLCSAYPWMMVSAINLIPLIIIINPIRPALVVPKFVKIVQIYPKLLRAGFTKKVYWWKERIAICLETGFC